MSDIYIRGLTDDIQALLKEQAKRKNMSMNEYSKHLLTHCAIAGMPAMAAILPGTIEYTIRDILRQDTDRLLAYSDAQTRIMRESNRVMQSIELLLQNGSTLPKES